jgi:hypothetical protein
MITRYLCCLNFLDKNTIYLNKIKKQYYLLNNAKNNHQYDLYYNYLIQLSIINKQYNNSINNIKLYSDAIYYFKKNGRYDLVIKCYEKQVETYDIVNNSECDYGLLYENVSEIYYEMENWQDCIDNLLRAKYYYEKNRSSHFINRINFRIAIIKIIENKYLEAIFLLEDYIFKNNFYIDKKYIKDSINFSLISYLCLIDFKKDYFLKFMHFRKKVEEYRSFLKDYCETYDYLFIINLLSCLENKNLEHFHYEIGKFFESIENIEFKSIYEKLFKDIQKNIKEV